MGGVGAGLLLFNPSGRDVCDHEDFHASARQSRLSFFHYEGLNQRPEQVRSYCLLVSTPFLRPRGSPGLGALAQTACSAGHFDASSDVKAMK